MGRSWEPPRSPGVYSDIHTEEHTKVRFWDLDVPEEHGKVLDDAGLRATLPALTGFAEAAPHGRSKFVLITTVGHPSGPFSKPTPLTLRADTLQCLIQAVGFPQEATARFLQDWMPHQHIHFQYDDSGTNPTSMSVLFRLPRHSRSLMAVLRVHFATRNCVAFVCFRKPEDLEDIHQRCVVKAHLLKTHPLYLLSIIYDHRFHGWGKVFTNVWNSIAEMEMLTAMCDPRYGPATVRAELVQATSTSDTLLGALYGLNTEFCHCQTVMSFALRFGKFCLDTLDQAESRRQKLGLPPLDGRHRSDLEGSYNFIIGKLEPQADRLVELKDRLMGQINVSHNLIAQRNSEINLAVAKLQTRDSQTMKGIAVLTLVFLPSTLIATVWSTNLIQLEGDKNWQIYLSVSILLTLTVVLSWLYYLSTAQRRQDRDWPELSKSGILKRDYVLMGPGVHNI